MDFDPIHELYFSFSDEVRHCVDDEEYDSESIRRSLRKLLNMCNLFNHFVDVVLHVQTTGVRDVSSQFTFKHVKRANLLSVYFCLFNELITFLNLTDKYIVKYFSHCKNYERTTGTSS